ncbi:MAG: class I SAM-dependent DNA methyltransferase [Verrucomicrobia bacterium]|nr:class I SAM-dependent DNA methyltransferase [Verrucomicrobiota bacterium]
MTDEQRSDMQAVCGHLPAWGLLDYVTAWYFKAGQYIQGTHIVVGFVSTNSISQGEQVGLLWNELLPRYHLKIHFAHRTFPWESEARGKAHVHVVIIGFANFDTDNKRIYEYEAASVAAVYDRRERTLRTAVSNRRSTNSRRSQTAATETVTVTTARNISPYLVEGSDVVVLSRSKPIGDVPAIVNGSKQVDGGFLVLTDQEKMELLAENPAVKKFIRPFLGSEEFIKGISRWCLWLVDASPTDIRNNDALRRRVEGVRQFRLKSKKAKTRESAETPTLFGEIRPIATDFLAIPEVSSERRQYIPIGFLAPSIVPSNKIQVVPDATLFHFGVLSSAMHMAWVRQVTGRLKSDYSYSAKIVYNNYPWPLSPSEKQREAVEAAAQGVLEARAGFPNATLADLYDPLAMPPALRTAHERLDRAVERCYRPEPFASDRQRVEFLFALYERLTAPLVAATKPKRRKAE